MKYKKIASKHQIKLKKILEKYPQVIKIAQAIKKGGGTSLLVGGAVRDLLLGLPIKDLDIEVHNISLEQLEQILRMFGRVSLVGKAYGVLRLHGLDVDWSVPRTDKPGRKPQVAIDPHMSMQEAFRRRDLTINAMGIDIISYALIDPFNGLNDLKKGILRAPDTEKFVEDPLRFFRVMQFIGRFGMQPDKELNALCKTMDVKTVSRERIETEFEKLLLRSKQPSLGIRWLESIGRLQEVLPELAATKNIKQDKKWHPEGDVFEHSMQALDAMAQIEHKNVDEKLMLMYAALCHDLGKSNTTKEIEGSIKSLGHAKESARLTKHLLKRITNNKVLIKTVATLVNYHMHPLQFIKGNAKQSAYKRLANKLAPYATLMMLAKLAIADKQGRNAKNIKPLKKIDSDIKTFVKQAEKAQVLAAIEKPILQGRDLLEIMKPGPDMGRVLKKAYEIQLSEGIKDKKVLKERVLKMLI